MNEEINGYNLALGKPTQMSSTFGSYVSSNAVDGNSSNTGMSCSLTLKQNENWWQVDLQAIYVIREVVITTIGHRNGELECVSDTVF